LHVYEFKFHLLYIFTDDVLKVTYVDLNDPLEISTSDLGQ